MEKAGISHAIAHYLLVIHNLRERKGYARVTDISKELGVSKGSVSITLNTLKTKKLVEEERDTKFLVLTEYGHTEIHKILANRALFFSFFKDVLKVSEDEAREGACAIEHLIRPEVREKFFGFLKALSSPKSAKGKKDLIKTLENLSPVLELQDYKSLQEFIDDRESEF